MTIIKSIPQPVFPEGVKCNWWTLEEDEQGLDINEDAIWIELPNGYGIDVTGCWRTRIATVQVIGGMRDWDKPWESFKCYTAEEVRDSVVRLVNRWLKLDPVDPRIEEGKNASYEWQGPYGSLYDKCKREFEAEFGVGSWNSNDRKRLVYLGKLRSVIMNDKLAEKYQTSLELLQQIVNDEPSSELLVKIREFLSSSNGTKANLL